MTLKATDLPGYLSRESRNLLIDGLDAVEIAHEHGTPLFVYSESRIRHNIDRLKRVADVISCPLKICYAAKAMSTMGILTAVKDAGIDIEVNSGGELWKALKAGFRGEQIIFNGTSKEVWEIELAVENKIYAIQVDSLYELSLIEETVKRLGKRANISLRLVPEIESHTHSGLQTALLTSKFGMMPDEAYDAFREYHDSPHLAMNGIHLHIGSQNPDPQVYTDAFLSLFASLKRIHTETGIVLKHVNLGGGFPVDYIGDDGGNLSGSEGVHDGTAAMQHVEFLSASFEPSAAIAEAWKQVLAEANATNSAYLLDNLTILLEPGRSIIADAGICLTTVRNTKQRPTNGELRIENGEYDVSTQASRERSDRSEFGDETSAPDAGTLSILNSQLSIENWLLTDAGFNILLSMETYKWYYHLISASWPDEPHETPYKVAGPLCDGGDVYFDIEGEGRLPEHRLLPANIEPGEVLALLNCGAYSLAQASQYNGRFLPPVVLIDLKGTPRSIRRRETFDDLVASDT